MTLFKFNPPGQESPKETKTDTTRQETPAAADTARPSEPTPPANETPQPAAPKPPETPPQEAPVPVGVKPVEAATPSAQTPPPAQQQIPPKPEEPPRAAPAPVDAKPVEATIPPVQNDIPPSRRRPTVAPQRMLTESPSEGKNALLATILSIFLVVLAIGLYVYLGEKPPVAAGEISKMWVYSVHTTTRPLVGEGASGEPSSFDQVLIVAKVKLHNQSDHPIVLWDMSSNIKDAAGETDASAVGPGDFRRAFVAYPKLDPAQGTPLLRETTLEPGQQIEGMILTHYNMTKEQWDNKASFNFKIVFRYQKSLILQPPHDIEVIQ